MTQLYNPAFGEILSRAIKRFNRRKYTSLSIMMIAIDHFKELNDRYGGEEFAIVMPDTHLDGAAHKAEIPRQKVQLLGFPTIPEPIHCTISIEVAAYETCFPHDLIKAADKALYQAKNAGRNTVVVSQRDEGEVQL